MTVDQHKASVLAWHTALKSATDPRFGSVWKTGSPLGRMQKKLEQDKIGYCVVILRFPKLLNLGSYLLLSGIPTGRTYETPSTVKVSPEAGVGAPINQYEPRAGRFGKRTV